MLGNRLNQSCYSIAGNGRCECSESKKKRLDGAWEYIRLNTRSYDRWDFISRTAL